VQEAIKVIRPQWVDVSSSVEAMPGKKDSVKVEKFIKAAHI
jgi:phosphoribosylanthranilate isomerase